MPTDLERAFKALEDKQKPYNDYFKYYDGDQPLMYTASRLKEVFKGLDARFTQNWCAVVIDAVKDRVNLRAIRVPSQVDTLWKEMWQESELALESDDCHESAMVASEGFMIVDNDGQAYANDPRMVAVFYDAERPRVKKYAAKWWRDDSGRLRMTLYYPTYQENYITSKSIDDKILVEAKDLQPMSGNDEKQRNPLGEIPVFHFLQGRRNMKSDLKSVIPIQNGINKLLSDMMVAAEFGAFKQRYVISSVEVNGKLKNAPSEIWDLPSGDGTGQQTQVGQFEETPLENYLKAIEQAANSLSSITRTPKHYFFSIGSNLSGESLYAMEGPLVKKASDRIERYQPVWRKVAALMLKARGKSISVNEIVAEYDRPQIEQPKTIAETRQYNVNAGMPLVTVLRDEGKSDDYIDRMLEDKQAESDQQQTSLAQSLLNAQKRFSNGQGA